MCFVQFTLHNYYFDTDKHNHTAEVIITKSQTVRHPCMDVTTAVYHTSHAIITDVIESHSTASEASVFVWKGGACGIRD